MPGPCACTLWSPTQDHRTLCHPSFCSVPSPSDPSFRAAPRARFPSAQWSFEVLLQRGRRYQPGTCKGRLGAGGRQGWGAPGGLWVWGEARRLLAVLRAAAPNLLFLSPQYIGSLDVPRPNSRVEIVTAMRRIRVSAAGVPLCAPSPGSSLTLQLPPSKHPCTACHAATPQHPRHLGYPGRPACPGCTHQLPENAGGVRAGSLLADGPVRI